MSLPGIWKTLVSAPIRVRTEALSYGLMIRRAPLTRRAYEGVAAYALARMAQDAR
jgi:hypothetical protein